MADPPKQSNQTDGKNGNSSRLMGEHGEDACVLVMFVMEKAEGQVDKDKRRDDPMNHIEPRE